MACFGGKKQVVDPAEEKRNKEIENQLKEEKKNQVNKMKLLLLGTLFLGAQVSYSRHGEPILAAVEGY